MYAIYSAAIDHGGERGGEGDGGGDDGGRVNAMKFPERTIKSSSQQTRRSPSQSSPYISSLPSLHQSMALSSKTGGDVSPSSSAVTERRKPSGSVWTPPMPLSVPPPLISSQTTTPHTSKSTSHDVSSDDEKIKHVIDSVLHSNYQEKRRASSAVPTNNDNNNGNTGGQQQRQPQQGQGQRRVMRIGPPTHRDSYSTISTGPGERVILQNTKMKVVTKERRMKAQTKNKKHAGNSGKCGGDARRSFVPLEIIVYTTGPATREQQKQQRKLSFSSRSSSTSSTYTNSFDKIGDYANDDRRHNNRFPMLQKERKMLPDARNIMDVYGEDDAEIIFVPSMLDNVWKAGADADADAESISSSVMEVPQRYLNDIDRAKRNIGSSSIHDDDDDDDEKFVGITRIEI
jgi:hypothetical protein